MFEKERGTYAEWVISASDEIRRRAASAWSETLARKGEAPAIFDTAARVLRTFSQIEHRSRELEHSLGKFNPGDVVAIQIGNHEDWPSWLIASLRRELVALPLEPGMGEQERANALRICNAAAGSGRRGGGELSLTATRTQVGKENPPSLLKLFRNNGPTARDPFPQRAVARRLRQHLRHDGNYRCRR